MIGAVPVPAQRQAHVLDQLVDEDVLTRVQADEVAAADWALVTG